MDIILAINAVIYLGLSIYFYKKDGLTVFTGMWMFFTLFAVGGFIIFLLGIYDERFSNLYPNYKIITFEPYIYFLVSNFLLLYPLRSVKKTSSFLSEQYDTNAMEKIINIIVLFMVAYTLVKFSVYLKFSSMSLLDRRIMSISGDSFIDRNKNPLLWLVDYFMSITHMGATPFVLLYALRGIIKNYINIKRFFILIIITFSAPSLGFIIASNRSGLVLMILNFLLFLILFYYEIDRYIRNQIIKILISATIPIIVVLYLITQERYENSETSALVGVLSYFGEPFPNLGTFVYYDVSRHSYGMLLFPDYVKALTGITMNIEGGLDDYYKFWTNFTGVNAFVFKTYFGALYLEFGTLFALLFMSVLSCISTSYFAKAKKNHLLIILYYIYI